MRYQDKVRTLQSVWGISIGDQIRSGPPYNTRGEVHKIWPPRYTEPFVGGIIIRTWQVISIGMGGESGINYIRRDGNRFFDDVNHEYFFTSSKPTGQFQWTMDFYSQINWEPPYPFVPGLDYYHDIWKCPTCGDFNAPPEKYMLETGYRWYCPTCSKYGVKKLIVMLPRDKVKNPQNACIIAINHKSDEVLLSENDPATVQAR